MKKHLLSLIAAALVAVSSVAATINGFKYQAVVRNQQGAVIENSTVLLKVSILQGAENGTSVYSEQHEVTTNAFGLINVIIGSGTSPTGNFTTIDWSGNSYFLKVEMAVAPNTELELLGVSPLLSVPYALHAETVANNNDADADPVNEIQQITLTGTTLSITQANSVDLTPLVTTDTDEQNLDITGDQLSISNGNSVNLAPYKDNTDAQNLNLSGTTLAITGGNTVDLSTLPDSVNDADADPTNEMQSLSIATDQLSISGSNQVDLTPYKDNTDAQNLDLTGDQLSISNGNSVSLASYKDNTDAQNLTLTGTTLAITGGNDVDLSTLPDLVNDADADPTNEIQDLTLTGSTLKITNNASATEINLAPFAGTNTDEQTLYIDEDSLGITNGNKVLLPKQDVIWDTAGTAIFYNLGNVGIGNSNPVALLDVTTSINYHFGAFYSTLGAASIGAFNDGFSAWQPLSINPGGQVWFMGGNVGIGTTSPATKLHISTSGNPRALRISGTSSTDYAEAQFAGNGREYRFGVGGSAVTDGSANKFYFYDATASVFRLMLDANGNFGIGTAVPAASLHVNSGEVRFPGAGGGNTHFNFSDSKNYIRGTTIIADGGGNVGIGTTSPTTKLHVVPGQVSLTGSTNPYLGLHNGSYQGYLEILASNVMGLTYNGAIRIGILNNGNVGIGTTTPSVKLDVIGNARFGNYQAGVGNINAYSMELGGSSPSATNGVATIFFHHHSVSAHQLRYNSGVLYLEAAGNGYGSTTTPSLSVGGSLYAGVNGGNIGIGTTTPSARMVVQGASTDPSVPLFVVNNRLGQPVFLVYQDSVRIIVKDDYTKGSKGVLAVSGRNTSKGLTGSFMVINSDNTLIGQLAGSTITSGLRNVFLGANSGQSNSTGSYNVFLGDGAGIRNTAGAQNVFIGRNSGLYNRTGGKNVFIGWSDIAAFPFLDPGNNGSNNTLIGYSTSFTATGNYNTAMGSLAGHKLLSGTENCFFGYASGNSNTSGSYNSSFGSYALSKNSTGLENCAFGAGAMEFSSTGSYNSAFGTAALQSNATGNYNTAIGWGANSYSTAYSNSTAIGYIADNTASNQVRIGNSSVTSIGGYAAWSNLSDKRFKKEVKSNVPGLEFILKLRPITYYLDLDKLADFLNSPDSLRLLDNEKSKESILQTGFAAQEVEEAANSLGYEFSGVDKPKNEMDYYSLRYAEFTVPLVKAVQELNNMNLLQQQEIEILKTENSELKNRLLDVIKRLENLENK